ncbi:hypothetical protein U1Q18_018216 [Sarracenia purpurea var. burkii]
MASCPCRCPTNGAVEQVGFHRLAELVVSHHSVPLLCSDPPNWRLLSDRLCCSAQLYRASDCSPLGSVALLSFTESLGQLWSAPESQVGCCSVDAPRSPGRA